MSVCHVMLYVGDTVDGGHLFDCPQCPRRVEVGAAGFRVLDPGDWLIPHSGSTAAGFTANVNVDG